MGYAVDDMWRVWSDLTRKEDELKWGGHAPGFGPQYNSMGRPANASAPFNNSWGSEQMGRVNRVRKALNDSGSMAKSMIARTLSGIDLSTIWPILVSACQDIALYYGGSVAAGGFIGGAAGAFFGGVGAVPGAAAGAAAGGYIGGWVLAMLGLKSLAEDVAQAIPEALRHYEKGFLEAWGPTRHDHRHGFSMAAGGNPSFAALHLANGHVIMISAILAVLAAYLTRGRGDMLKDIRQSPRLGPKVASWVEANEDKLRRHLALQSRGRGASPGEAPPQPKPRREAAKEQGRDGSGNSVRNSKIARDARADDGVNSVRSVESSLNRVRQLRQSLDIGAKRNIAFAEYNINGETGELVSISGNAWRPGTVGIPETRRFGTIATGNNTRQLDSEVKIFEHLGSRLPPDATGTLHLFSELPLCVSCTGVVPQFQQAYPGIRVIVTHGPGR